jgi:hypothetical protein
MAIRGALLHGANEITPAHSSQTRAGPSFRGVVKPGSILQVLESEAVFLEEALPIAGSAPQVPDHQG